jgi:hypothetical protein
MRGSRWETPQGTLWARDRVSDSAAAKVRLTHVDQGYLNDCFLAATIGALAVQRPWVLERMVTRHGDLIRVNLPGGPLLVDRELPVRDGRPMFAGSGTNRVLWPSYVEKAIATRMRGGYRALDQGGDVRQAFEWLTGSRPHTVRAPGDGGNLEFIRSKLRSGHAVVVGTPATRHGSRLWRAMRQYDLHDSHAYVVTAVAGASGALRLRLWNIWGIDHPKPIGEDAFTRLFDEVVADDAAYVLG